MGSTLWSTPGSQQLHRPHLGHGSGKGQGGVGVGGSSAPGGAPPAVSVWPAGPRGSRGCQVFPVSAPIPPPAAEEK